MTRHASLLVGTAKGLFACTPAPALAPAPGGTPEAVADGWQLRGPMLSGWEIGGVAVLGDRWLVGTAHMAYGPVIRVSDDRGATWRQIEQSPAFTAESGRSLKRIWQIVPGTEPDTLYAGTEEAGLFVSRDRGESWQAVPAFNDHPTRAAWSGGSCPLCVHTILTDPHNPRQLWAAVSAAGVFRSDDGGASWSLRNEGLPGPRVDGLPGPKAHVQKLAQDPHRPDTLYLQHHDGGLFRSTDGGGSWHPLSDGLPTRFGFALCTTPTGDAVSIPLDPKGRYFPEGQATVYRLRPGDDRWQPLNRGLNDEPRFTGVLRDALTPGSPAPGSANRGLYFGTTDGSVFASPDGGESWAVLPARLSRITTLRAWGGDEAPTHL